MKNLIDYYYNLIVSEYKKSKNKFSFTIEKTLYEFTVFKGDSSRLLKIYWIISSSHNYYHEIVLNRNGSFFTKFSDDLYILVKKSYSIKGYVNFNEIANYTLKTNTRGLLNWKKLWEEKIDYYEYQMSQIFSKYPEIKKSFNYYVGMAETAISLLNYVDKKTIDYYICHNRIEYKEKLDEFYNPVNMTMDYWVRDVSEYIKINYLNGGISLQEVLEIIDGLNFNYSDCILFFSRLVYPSYYFDIYDQIIQDTITEEKIDICIKKNTAYEVFLKKVYSYMTSKNALPEIEWLKN